MTTRASAPLRARRGRHLRGREARRRHLGPARQDRRPHRRPGLREAPSGLPGQPRHRARLRQPRRRGPHRRPGRLDHPSRHPRRHLRRAPGRLRRGLLRPRPPLPRPLPHRRRGHLRGHRHHRLLERLHRPVQRLAAGLRRPERLGGREGRALLSYVSDPGTGGTGAFVDDVRLVTGTTTEAEGFETSFGAWSTPGAPAGSPGNGSDWTRSAALFHSRAAVTTRDTVLLGFGLEHVPGTAERARLVGRALKALHR